MNDDVRRGKFREITLPARDRMDCIQTPSALIDRIGQGPSALSASMLGISMRINNAIPLDCFALMMADGSAVVHTPSGSYRVNLAD